MASHEGRVDSLVPVRVGRMVASPYGFLRGTAVVMAEDLGHLPATGIRPVICGDSHLGNFGFYASPERDLVIDLNDFDEAHPGSWEWDLRRLAASIWVAGRQNSASEAQCKTAVAVLRRDLPRAGALARGAAAAGPRVRAAWTSTGSTTAPPMTSLRAEIRRAARRARANVSDRALPRLTEQHDSGRRIVAQPPLITRLDDAEAEQVARGLDDYLETLPTQWRRVLSGYTLVDVAHKVVGVGSVGLRAYVALCEGSTPDDVVFLQLKQARRSVVAPFVHGRSAWHAHQGQRVVEYQQALQTVSDPLLGWTTVQDRQYYVRQFRNMKGTIAVDSLDGAAPDRLRGHLRPAAGQGPRADQRRLHDRGVRRVVAQAGQGHVPLRARLRRPDRTRPREPGAGRRPGCAPLRAGDVNPRGADSPGFPSSARPVR